MEIKDVSTAKCMLVDEEIAIIITCASWLLLQVLVDC
jgi:hypothetical protein